MVVGSNPIAVIYELLSASVQGVKILFFLAYAIAGKANNEAGIKSNKKYFLPSGKIENYNVLMKQLQTNCS